MKHIDKIKYIGLIDELGIDHKDVLIISSSVMAIFGLRENKDLDIIVPIHIWNDLYSDIRVNIKVTKLSKYPCIVYKELEIFNMMWPMKLLFEDVPSFPAYGYNLQTLDHLHKWKIKVGREKDIKDAAMIENFTRGI